MGAWALLVTLLTLAQITATLLVHQSFLLTLITDVIGMVLISSALLVFLANVTCRPAQANAFWILLSVCWGIRVFGQFMWMYFDLIVRKEVPNPFDGDILLFLSNIPVLAALLLQPRTITQQDLRTRRTVDFLLLLLWWLYLYLFFVIPWQYVLLDEAAYGRGYDRLNGLLDFVLLVTLGFLWSHNPGRWKWFYASFFTAQLAITASGYLANHAIDLHTYYPGSWYDLPYSASLASFTIVGLLGLTHVSASPTKRARAPIDVTTMGMLAVLSLPVFGAWAVFDRDVPARVTQFRELVTLGTVLAMAFLVFAKQHRLRAELARANLVLAEASLTDPLTGARNRRFFDATISADASQVLRSYDARENTRFSDLIFYMVDLDDFKEINDCYGHESGDKVLVEVTRRIISAIRLSDILIRWGGDEFLIVSRYSNRAEAATFAQRIMSAVAVPMANMTKGDAEIRQTCSIGWAAFPWLADDAEAAPLEAVLGLADRAVYEAKTSGKNRAIGISPSESGTTFLIATAGDRVSDYSVQTYCVIGPTADAG